MARVFSGADGSVLHHLEGEAANDNFGQFVNDAGDVNGDGFDDFMVGAPGFSGAGVIAAGRAYLFSGLDGSLLQTFDGTFIGQQYGLAMSGIGDANQDGYADVNVGAPNDPTAGPGSGAAFVFESSVETDPGSVTLFGTSCPTSYGWLPLITVTGRPTVGGTYTVNLGPLMPGTHPAAQLRIGNSNTSIGGEATLPFPLEAAIGCTLYINRIARVDFVPNPSGTSISQTIPNSAALIGTNIYHQMHVDEPGRNLLGRVFTNAVKITVGQ